MSSSTMPIVPTPQLRLMPTWVGNQQFVYLNASFHEHLEVELRLYDLATMEERKLDFVPNRGIFRDLRCGYVRRFKARPRHPATDGGARRRAPILRDHGGRCRAGRRRRPAGRHSRHRRRIRLHRSSYSGSQTRPPDRSYARFTGRRRKPDVCTEVVVKY